MLTASLRSACLLLCAVGAWAAAFKEEFDDSWQSRWKKSSWKTDEGTDGEFTLTAGKWYGDAEADKGIQTGPDARFYALYTELEQPFDNEGKDLVLQFSVKHEQKLDCGGGYIKLVPSSVRSAEMQKFSGDTPYAVMFGPDICGYSTKKVHVILTYKDKNHLISKNIECKSDDLSHVYTLAIHPNNTYKVFIDGEQVRDGSLEEDWSMLPPKQIKDASASKPEDWDDRARIPDPEDSKPEDWDDSIPAQIADPEATKPDDWDDANGEWEAPKIPNPDYKGEWKPKMIDNPNYKGIWSAPMIDNPEYTADPNLYHRGPIKYLGFELWQVKSGSIFDNIMLTDSLSEALTFVKDTWGKNHEAEEAMRDKAKEAEKAEMGGDDDDDGMDMPDMDFERMKQQMEEEEFGGESMMTDEL